MDNIPSNSTIAPSFLNNKLIINTKMCKAHSNTRHGNLRLTTDSCGCASSAHSAFCVIKNSYYTKKTSYSFVGSPMPATGIEPVWEYKSRRILSPVRLPVPPHRLGVLLIIAIIMIAATRMGFEPTTSAVTGRRSNQLSHQAITSRTSGPSGTRTQDRPVMSRLL